MCYEVWLTMAEVTSWLRLHREAVTMLRPLLAMKNERALKLQDWLMYRAKQSVGDYRDCDKIPEHEIEECVGPVNIAPTRYSACIESHIYQPRGNPKRGFSYTLCRLLTPPL